MSDQTNDTTKPRLDMQTLEQRALHLPPEMRELFVWLGCYTAQDCSRDVDILTAHFKELGFDHNKTTWSRILRGMWQQDAHGNATPAPILSSDKFCKAVNALKNSARIKEIGGRVPFVMTPTAQKIFDFIEVKRAPDRVCKFGVIIGETGTQKTASLKEYCRQNNHGACVIVEAPETPSMTQFMTDLAKEFNFNAQSGYLRKKTYVLDVVNAKKTIIIENIQRLYDPHCGDKQPIFSFVHKLQEDTNCTIIMSFTPVFEKIFLGGLQKGFFEQFEGRAGGRRNFLRLADYPPEEDVLMIAKAFGLKDADKHIAELVKIVKEPGRIRRLFDDLQDAKISAEAEKEKLTINHIRAARGED